MNISLDVESICVSLAAEADRCLQHAMSGYLPKRAKPGVVHIAHKHEPSYPALCESLGNACAEHVLSAHRAHFSLGNAVTESVCVSVYELDREWSSEAVAQWIALSRDESNVHGTQRSVNEKSVSSALFYDGAVMRVTATQASQAREIVMLVELFIPNAFIVMRVECELIVRPDTTHHEANAAVQRSEVSEWSAALLGSLEQNSEFAREAVRLAEHSFDKVVKCF